MTEPTQEYRQDSHTLFRLCIKLWEARKPGIKTEFWIVMIPGSRGDMYVYPYEISPRPDARILSRMAQRTHEKLGRPRPTKQGLVLHVTREVVEKFRRITSNEVN
jgi:hypothetical protein